MNKKLAIIAIACVICIVLGGINNVILFGTQYLTTKEGYTYVVGESVGWWNCNWSYCKKIIIDCTKVQANQVNFPVLLYRASDSDLAAHAQSDGSDIVFVSNGNVTQYDHEIESYNSATGELVVWVEITSLSSLTDTILYMYYGNPDCSNQQNAVGTWNSDYILVHHLNESSGTHEDSTSNDNDGTCYNDVDQDVTGRAVLDGADTFDGIDDYIDCGTSSSLNITADITLEAWVQDPPLKQRGHDENDVLIVDKRDEYISLIPSGQFIVKRTITADADVVFAALYSPGVRLIDMIADDISVFAGTYPAGRPTVADEQEIETIRTTLPEKIQNQRTVAYSQSLTIQSKTTITMVFITEQWYPHADGTINYLALSSNGDYDFESTTHWSYPIAQIDWFNPFSIFQNVIDLFTGGDDDSGDDPYLLRQEDTTLPSVQFVNPTPSNGTQYQKYIHINLSSSDASTHYAFADWNATLLSWLRMDYITESTVTDNSSNGNDGTTYNQAAQSDLGRFGKSIDLDGDEDYVDTGITCSDLGLSSNWGNATMAFWFYVNATSDWLVGCANSGAGSCGAGNVGFTTYILSSGESIQFRVYNDTGAETCPKVMYTSNFGFGWKHYALVFNDTTIEQYVNGTADGTLDVSGQNFSVPAYTLKIGGRGDIVYGAEFDGRIDEFMLFNRTLTQNEIQSLYDAGTYQYERNFTDLDNDTYTFRGYAVDAEGNQNQTATRTVTIDDMATSVDTIDPYNVSTSPLTINATGNSTLDNVSLWYRYSSDNASWNETGYKVQRGLFQFPADETSYNMTIASVNTTQAFVLCYPYMRQLVGTPSTTANIGDANYTMVTAFLSDSTTIQFQRSGATDNIWVDWQVLECFNEEFTVQRGEKSFSGVMGQSTTDTISTEVTPANSMAWHTMRTTYTTDDGREMQFHSNVTDSTTITFARTLGGGSITGAFRWVVVEWNTSKIDSFQIGDVLSPNEVDTEYSISELNITLDTPIDTSDSILLFQSRAQDDDGLESSSTAGAIKDTDEISFYNYDTTLGSSEIHWYVIDFGSDVVSNQSGRDDDNNPTTWSGETYTLGTSVDTDRALVFTSQATNGDGTAKPRHTHHQNLTSGTTLVTHRNYTGMQTEISWQVIELPYDAGWQLWSDASNPDDTSPWSWNFDFPNETGYYEFYSIGNKSGYANETAPSSADAICNYTAISAPTVSTNASTGVEETSATLHGYLQSDGGENCTVYFNYDSDADGVYDISTGPQTKSTGDEFSAELDSITQGQLYKYQAYANNTEDSDTGIDMYFLTKPDEPSGFTASTYNQTQINLSWAQGTGANNTYIVRQIGGYPSDRTDGTNVYNDTGTSYSDTGLDQKTRYYYRAWSYSEWWQNGTAYTQFSDSYDDDTAATTILRLINCSTDQNTYAYGGTVTFSAKVDADISSSVRLLIASNLSNLDSSSYSDQTNCIAYSDATIITSQPQTITATMSATADTSWYAKICDSTGRNSYIQENTSWNKTYASGGNDADAAYLVTVDSNDNVYVVGYGTGLNGSTGSDWWIMRFNNTGVRDLNKTYTSGGNDADAAVSVAVDSNDNVYVVGYGTGLNGSTGLDWWIKRFDSDGIEDIANWNKTYTSSGNDEDVAVSVAVDSNDNVYVVGYGTGLNGSTGVDWWIKRFDSDGIEDTANWNKTYTSSGNDADAALSASVDSNDNVYVVGYGTGLNGSTGLDWWIKRFDSDGIEDTANWNKTYTSSGNDEDVAYSVAVDSNDNISVIGTGTGLNGSTGLDWWIMKFNNTGNRDLNKTYASSETASSTDEAFSAAVDSNDNVYVVGYGTGLNGSTGLDWWIKKFNSTGSEDTTQWNLSYHNGNNDYARSVANDSNDNIYIVGEGTNLNDTTGQDWWIKKFEYFTGNFTTVTDNKQIISKTQSAYSLEINAAGDTLYGYIKGVSASTSIDTNWHYVALTYDGSSSLKLYKDGEEVSTASPSGSIPTNADTLRIGRYFSGTLDELRISMTERTAAWINTTFENTNDPETFATFGNEIGVLSTWTYRKKITFNSSMIDEDLTNFPVLIYNASDTNLKDNALSNGSDIIFVESTYDWITSTWRDKLDHEIELYNSTNGNLVAWVRIPTLSSSTDTEIYMYYGNTICVSNRENATGVWDVNYSMVQHLEESSGTLEDSTSNDNNGTNVDDNATFNASAKIDGGYYFDGVGAAINISNNSALAGTRVTISAWINLSGLSGSYDPIVTQSDADWAGYYLYAYDVSGNNRVAFWLDDTESAPLLGLDSKQWYHVVGVHNDTNLSVYIDGIQRKSTEKSGSGNNKTGYIGYDDVGDYFHGVIDEVRISNSVRNTSWINTSYNNVNDTANFTTFGSEEIQNVAPVLSSPSPSDGATGIDLYPTLSITVNDVNANALNLTWHSNSSGDWKEFGRLTSSATNRFGYDTGGGSWDDINNTILGSNFTCPANGTVSSIVAYIKTAGTFIGGRDTKVKAAIYYTSNDTLLAASQEKTYDMETIDPTWETFTFSSPPSLTAGEEYYLVLWADTSANENNYARLYYNSANSTKAAYQSQTYNGFPDPWSPTTENKAYSIYCTYTTTNIYNGTYYMDNLNFSANSTKYYWSVNVSDNTAWTNATYSFTTKAQALRAGASSNIYNYIDTENNNAWYGTNAGTNPPSTILKDYVFNSTDYQNINTSDDIYMSTNGTNNTDYPYHTFRFNISDSDIDEITMKWEGKVDNPTGTNDVYFYIWNITNNTWDKLQETNASTDVNLTNTTTAISNYVNSTENNSLHLMVISNKGTDGSLEPPVLYTDYVEIKVFY